MRNEVDPRRFIGKRFTRRQAFPHAANDYSILIDGLVAGRIMEKRRADQRLIWFWTMTSPYYPYRLHHGEEDSYEAARDAFKALFWEWHAWALKQTGMAMWYGDE